MKQRTIAVAGADIAHYTSGYSPRPGVTRTYCGRDFEDWCCAPPQQHLVICYRCAAIKQEKMGPVGLVVGVLIALAFVSLVWRRL